MSPLRIYRAAIAPERPVTVLTAYTISFADLFANSAGILATRITTSRVWRAGTYFAIGPSLLLYNFEPPEATSAYEGFAIADYSANAWLIASFIFSIIIGV